MGSLFDPFGSTSSQASDSRTVATDQGKVFRASVGQYTESGGLSVGTHGTVVGQGATSLQGNSKLNLGYDLSNSKGSTVNVTTADPEVLKDALGSISDLVTKYQDNVAAFIKQANDVATIQAKNSQDTLNTALGSIGGLVSNQQPAGTVQTNNTVLYIILALAAVAALFVWRK